MKYISADKLIAEIDNILSACTKQTHTGVFNTCTRIKGLITSIQQEQPKEELEKEIKNYLATKCAGDDEPSVSEIARHFYELGINARKGD